MSDYADSSARPEMETEGERLARLEQRASRMEKQVAEANEKLCRLVDRLDAGDVRLVDGGAE